MSISKVWQKIIGGNKREKAEPVSCCAVHSLGADHLIYARRLGLPEALVQLEYQICMGLPCDQALVWANLFLGDVRPGEHLLAIWPQFVCWLLADPVDGLIRFADTGATRAAVAHVASLYRQDCNDVGQWLEAASAAMTFAVAQHPDQLAAQAAFIAASARLSESGAGAYVAEFSRLAAEAASGSTGVNAYMRQSEKLLELL